MVGKSRRSRSRSSRSVSHQRNGIWGRHAVLEALRCGRWLPNEVYFAQDLLDHDEAAELRELAAARNVRLEEVISSELERLCSARDHQGYFARMPDYPYSHLPALISRLGPESLILILCGIQDPFNYGSILRSADLFEAAGVIVPAKGQAAVSSHVVRSSVGAVHYLDIIEVESLPDTCRELQRHGTRVVALSEKSQEKDFATEVSPPSGAIALLIGNEGQGVDADLLALADATWRIPHGGHVGSLNAAVAAGIACFAARQGQFSPQK